MFSYVKLYFDYLKLNKKLKIIFFTLTLKFLFIININLSSYLKVSNISVYIIVFFKYLEPYTNLQIFFSKLFYKTIFIKLIYTFRESITIRYISCDFFFHSFFLDRSTSLDIS